jgi:hypothetical protein
MTNQTTTLTHCCNHYPNRVLQKKDLAAELGGVCEKTVDNLVKAGKLPEPCWLNSIPVWMLYDVHAFLSAAAGVPRTSPGADTDARPADPRRTSTKHATHKAGKYSV